MKKAVVVLVALILSLLTTLPVYGGPHCSEVFRESDPFYDQSGFVNLFAAPKSNPEPAPKTTLDRVENLIKDGKRQVRKSNWAPKTLEAFREIHQLPLKELQELPHRKLIEIYGLHASWNVLLPPGFKGPFMEALSKSMEQWTQKDFQNFSFFRLLTPEFLPQGLQNQLRSLILSRFESWRVETKMQVLSAELIHSNHFSIKETKGLLDSIANSLSATTKVLQIKVVKETYRALVFLRSQQPTHFWNEIVRIESLIEKQLNQMGLFLYQGGSSGSNNPVRPFGPSFIRLMEVIDTRFPNQVKKFEYFDSRMTGLFDPVDLYYPNLRLIVEWDGPIHYFKAFRPDGTINQQTNILRPWDLIKDSSLRNLGIAVFRLNKNMNEWLETRDINEMIKEQNPWTWDH